MKAGVRLGVCGVLALILSAPGAGFATPTNADSSRFTCRASVVRVEGQVLNIPIFFEPIVANAQEDPCRTDTAGIINDGQPITLPAGLGSIRVLYAATENNSGAGEAEAGVLEVVLTVPGAPAITVEVLTAEAAATCPGPSLTGQSTVVGVQVGGTAIEVPFDGAHLDVPLGPVGTLHLNEQTTEPNRITQQALFLDTDLVDVVVAEAIADFHGNPCGGPFPTKPGWMTGGGKVVEGNANGGTVDPGTSVTHGFRLECDGSKPNSLQVNWGGNRFHLEVVTEASCSDNPAIDQRPPPSSGFDTLSGSGIGRCNGVPGATAEWTFVDAGEPGSRDSLSIDVQGMGCALRASGVLDGGNHQAHSRPA